MGSSHHLASGAAVLGAVLTLAVPRLDAATAPTRAIAAADSGAIHGQVLDAATGAPLVGVSVHLVELDRSERTHARGEFELDRLPSGRYTLVFEHIGYRREMRTVFLAAADSVRLRVALEFSAIELPGFVVTGTVDATAGEDALRATAVVGGQELSRELDATVAATIDDVPGLAAVSTGPATARPVIRGLGGDRILLLEDGERVGDLSAGSPDHAVAIEPVTAQRIEVLRGPAALLYGSNALGGVVNVIREEVPTSLPDRLHGTVRLQGQTANHGFTGGGSITGAAGPLAWRAEASARAASDLRTPIGTLENTQLETYNLSAGVAWVRDWGHAGAAYRYYDSDYGVPGYEGGHESGVTIQMRRRTVRGEAAVRPGGGPFSSIELDATYSNYYHRELEAGGILGTEFGLLSGVTTAVARHEALGPFSSGAIGLQAQWQDFATGGSLGTPPANEYAAAGFFLEELDFSPLRVQFGARYDWHRVTPAERDPDADIGDIRTRTFGSVSASLAALYDLGGGFGLGGSIARAFRTPGVSELYSTGPHLATYSFEVGNPDLEAETGLGVDLFLRIARDRLNAEIAAFRNDIDHYIYARNTGRISPVQLPIYQFVGEDAVFTGFEGRAQWNLVQGLVLDGTASYVRGTLTRTDEPLPLVPPFNGRIGLRYETPRFFIGGGWRAAARQDRVGEFETPTDGYHVFDATAGLRWTAFGQAHSLALRADNLTDRVYRDHLSRVKSIMPQPGRSVSLLYRMNF